jgi:hypothetical protein
MLGRDGAVMANVPYPLRNVMHKFIVGGARSYARGSVSQGFATERCLAGAMPAGF